jgi:hypothetical protein
MAKNERGDQKTARQMAAALSGKEVVADDTRTEQQKTRDLLNATRDSWATDLKKKVHAELAPIPPVTKKPIKLIPDLPRTKAIKAGLRIAGLTEQEMNRLQGKK